MFCMAADGADAAGFALKEQSASGLGTAFAGASANTEDISYLAYNPAGLAFQTDKWQAAIAGSYVIIDSKFKGGSASISGGAVAINPTAAFAGNDDVGEDALVPAFYGMVAVTDELKLGLGVDAPFGLGTDNPDGWIGRYHALKSELTTVEINPVVAYRVLPKLGIAAGFRALYGDAKLTNAIDFGTIGFSNSIPGSNPTNQDGAASVTGDGWAYGWNVGLMAEPLDGLHLGLAYRSSVDMDLKGTAHFTDDSAGVAAILRGATGMFADSGVKAKVKLPATLSLGGSYRIGEVTLLAEADLTRWSTFDELRVRFDNPNQADSVTANNWDDSWFYAGGVAWRPAFKDGLVLRTGVAYDESPIPDATRTPRIPGNDRLWVSFGAGYKVNDWLTMDAGYTHIFVHESTINLTTADPNNAARGNLSGSYETSIDIVAIEGTVRF